MRTATSVGWARGVALVAALAFAMACGVACRDREGGDLPSAIDVLVITDSNGVGPERWPARLEARVTAESLLRFHVEARPGRTWAVARGGETTWAVGGIRAWVDAVLRDSDGRLDLVVFALGTNDLQAQFAGGEPIVSRTRRAIARSLAVVRDGNPEVRIVLVAPPPLCDEAPGREIDAGWTGALGRRSAVDEALREAARTAGAIYVARDGLEGVSACTLTRADGVHLVEPGHARYADRVAVAIMAALARR